MLAIDTNLVVRYLVRDDAAQAAILIRLRRLALGLAGDTKSVGAGVFEPRVHIGPGYRVYFKARGRTVIILLAGGDKRTQAGDVRTALRLARELLE
mgnify:CR=1 FL=1